MNKEHGFTLIELLLVLAIIGIISAIAIPALLGQRESARNRATMGNAANIAGALQNALDIVEQPGAERTATDLMGVSTVTGTLTAVGARPEFLNMTNPFDGARSAYSFNRRATTSGEVGLRPINPSGTYFIEISYGTQARGAVQINLLAKMPETSLPL